MNRAQRMVRLLEKAGPEGVCLNDMPEQMRYCGRNAVSEAIAAGAKVVSTPCHKHLHGAPVSRYWLKSAYTGEDAKAQATVTSGKESQDLIPSTEAAAASPVVASLFPEYSRALGHGR